MIKQAGKATEATVRDRLIGFVVVLMLGAGVWFWVSNGSPEASAQGDTDNIEAAWQACQDAVRRLAHERVQQDAYFVQPLANKRIGEDGTSCKGVVHTPARDHVFYWLNLQKRPDQGWVLAEEHGVVMFDVKKLEPTSVSVAPAAVQR